MNQGKNLNINFKYFQLNENNAFIKIYEMQQKQCLERNI